MLSNVLADRRLNPVTPLHADNWERLLQQHGLLEEFFLVPRGIREGFYA